MAAPREMSDPRLPRVGTPAAKSPRAFAKYIHNLARSHENRVGRSRGVEIRSRSSPTCGARFPRPISAVPRPRCLSEPADATPTPHARCPPESHHHQCLGCGGQRARSGIDVWAARGPVARASGRGVSPGQARSLGPSISPRAEKISPPKNSAKSCILPYLERPWHRGLAACRVACGARVGVPSQYIHILRVQTVFLTTPTPAHTVRSRPGGCQTNIDIGSRSNVEQCLSLSMSEFHRFWLPVGAVTALAASSAVYFVSRNVWLAVEAVLTVSLSMLTLLLGRGSLGLIPVALIPFSDAFAFVVEHALAHLWFWASGMTSRSTLFVLLTRPLQHAALCCVFWALRWAFGLVMTFLDACRKIHRGEATLFSTLQSISGVNGTGWRILFFVLPVVVYDIVRATHVVLWLVAVVSTHGW